MSQKVEPVLTAPPKLTERLGGELEPDGPIDSKTPGALVTEIPGLPDDRLEGHKE